MPVRYGDDDALDLVNRIIEICPQIVFSKDLADEACPRIRQIGIRFPAQRGLLLKELDECGQDKLLKIKFSKIRKLSKKERKLLWGKRHQNVKDDVPAIEAASTMGAHLITLDPNIQRKRSLWERKLGFEVYSLHEVERR